MAEPVYNYSDHRTEASDQVGGLMSDVVSTYDQHFWRSPQDLEKHLIPHLRRLDGFRRLVVTGETENTSVYVMTADRVLALTPFQDLSDSVVMREVFQDIRAPRGTRAGIFPLTPALDKRLKLPMVVLINPYNPEFYPVPRLPLNISIIASYLRKHQKCNVHLLDMQLGLDAGQVLRSIIETKPEIIGVSIPHGQTTLAIEVLDKIFDEVRSGRLASKVVIGNFIAASLPQFFTKRYPEVMIATGEGEITMRYMVDYIDGSIPLEAVPGLVYLNSGQLKMNPQQFLSMDELPPPALDDIERIAELKGALTHEWSRGCFWKCTFCPREHKPRAYKGMSPPQVTSQLQYFTKVMQKFNLTNHLYVADEETVGGSDERETERLTNIARRMVKNEIGISFDTYTRVDQVYDKKQTEDWHVRRMIMWKLLRKAGLYRIFMGIESGSETQLMRYGKGIKPEDSIMAMRILSALGIEMRFGFVMFDPLMNFDEVVENILFLERNDVFIPAQEVDETRLGVLFQSLNDEEFVQRHTTNEAIYSRVSYMDASLEVLINASYIALLKAAERTHNRKLILDEEPELSIARLKVRYLNETISDVAKACQLWIDRNFAINYSVKGLFKQAVGKEKGLLSSWQKRQKKLSLDLMKSLVYICHDSEKLGLGDIELPDESKGVIQQLKERRPIWQNQRQERMGGMYRCLSTFEPLMSDMVHELEDEVIRGAVTDTADMRISKVIASWKSNVNSWKPIHGIAIAD